MKTETPFHRICEPYTFALLQWPALVALLTLDGPGLPWVVTRIALGLWLVAMLLAAYGGGRRAGNGNAMLLQCSFVAAAWWSHPSPWAFGWLAALAVLMRAAQRLRLPDSEPM